MTLNRIDEPDWRAVEGPWKGEPDRVDFEHAGLPCLLKRSEDMGNWCGYVAVPPGHPLHGKDYAAADVDVHGGVDLFRGVRGLYLPCPEARRA